MDFKLISSDKNLPKPIIYEVIRVQEGNVLFFEDHLNRLANSFEYFNDGEFSFDEILDNVHSVIEQNKICNQNLRIEMGNLKEQNIFYKIFPIDSFYPSKNMYKSGVEVVSILKKRKNPKLKLKDKRFKMHIEDTLALKNAYEGILIDDNNKILEGSRSNVFFVKGDTIITSKEGDALEGVTLKNVIHLMENESYNFIRKDIYMEDLTSFDGAFLTGTSIDILPIRKIDSYRINGQKNLIINSLIESFNNYKNELLGGGINVD